MPPRLSTGQEGDDDEPPTICSKCNLKYNTWMAYHFHKLSHPTHRKLTCAICSKDFASEQACTRHYTIAHPAKQQLSCPGCEAVFTRLGGLISHIESRECRSLVVPDFKERLVERKVFYDNHAEVRTQLDTSMTTGNLGEGAVMPIFSKPRLFGVAEKRGGNESYVAPVGASPASGNDSSSTEASFRLPSPESPLKALVPLRARDNLVGIDGVSRILPDPWDTPDSDDAPPVVSGATHPVVIQNTKKTVFDINRDFPPLGGHATSHVETFTSVENPASITQGGNVLKSKGSNTTGPQPMPTYTAIAKENMPITTNDDVFPPGYTAMPSATKAGPTASSPSKNDPTWSYNPSNPEFNIERYWIAAVGKFKCPHKGCKKSFAKQRQFRQHVSAHAKPQENLQCRNCLRWFASATALTQHSESQGVRCHIRDRSDFDARVDEFTAGTAAPVGRHADNTIRYAVNSNLRPDSSGVANIVAAHKAALQADEEDTAAFWDRKRPEW